MEVDTRFHAGQQNGKREEFRKTTGFDFMELRQSKISELSELGLMDFQENVLTLTPRGLLLADSIAGELL